MTPNLPKVQMQLVGADGNAFAILGRFRAEAKRQGWDKESIAEVVETATSGDYNHLLATIIEHTEDIGEDEGDDYEW
jgi:hypothetical protein